MPKKRNKLGLIIGILVSLALVFGLSYAVSFKIAKDNTIAENTTEEETTKEIKAEETSEFVIETETLPDIFESAVEVEIKEDTDVKLICLNRFTIMKSEYEPMLTKLEEGEDIWLWEEAASAFEEMNKAASESGCTLTPIDGYCGNERQDRRYETKVAAFMNDGQTEYEAEMSASYFVLPAGHCDQYLGLTVWIGQESTSFADTDEYIWLRNHAAEYGFVERYPSGKESVTYINYMPYVWRYVGVEAAKAMAEGDLCLEEYVR